MLAELMLLDEGMQEVEILDFSEGDFTIGTTNDFSIKVPPAQSVKIGRYIMVDEFTEYGGVIDGVEIDTDEDYITVTGRTWHGILEGNLVKPDEGTTHYTASGDANSIIGNLIKRVGLTDCLMAQPTPSGYTLTNYRFSRVSSRMGLYTAIRDMLRSVGAKLRLVYDAKSAKIVCSAVARQTYIDDGLDGDQRNFIITSGHPVNHLHCMGTGEGTERIRLDLYADIKGNISQKQSIYGVGHREEPYDSPTAEMSDLLADGTERLKELQSEIGACSIAGLDDGTFDIDDVVGGVSADYGVKVVTSVAEKIATLTDGEIIFETKTETEV